MNSNCISEDTIEESVEFCLKDMGWRISFSILSVVALTSFAVAWLFFLAKDYTFFQNVAMMVLSLVVFGAANTLVWISYKERGVVSQHCPEPNATPGKIIGIMWVIAAIVWLFYYAGDFSTYQNLAVLMMSVLVFGGSAISIGWIMRR